MIISKNGFVVFLKYFAEFRFPPVEMPAPASGQIQENF